MIRHVSVIGCVLAFAWLVTRGGSTRAEERQDERLYVPAGWFTMGSSPEQLAYARRLCVTERLPLGLGVRGCADDALFAREIPARRVYVSAFFIDRFELSQAHWALCLARGDCAPPAREVTHPSLQGPALPVVGLSHHDARALCRSHGGRLPSEAEWERAARGDSARVFPWGQAYNAALANHGEPALSLSASLGRPSASDGHSFTAPVRSFQEARSPMGAVQMAGNVWEWTASALASERAPQSAIDPPADRAAQERVVRGGSFRSSAFTLRVTHREARKETEGFLDVGVRCAYDVLPHPLP